MKSCLIKLKQRHKPLFFLCKKYIFKAKKTKGGTIMQIKTERGLIWVEAEYQSEERAIMDGYRYAFFSEMLNKKVYTKCLDDKGLERTFALIVGYN